MDTTGNKFVCLGFALASILVSPTLANTLDTDNTNQETIKKSSGGGMM